MTTTAAAAAAAARGKTSTHRPPRAARTGASSPSPGPPAPAARRPIVVLGENDARGARLSRANRCKSSDTRVCDSSVPPTGRSSTNNTGGRDGRFLPSGSTRARR